MCMLINIHTLHTLIYVYGGNGGRILPVMTVDVTNNGMSIVTIIEASECGKSPGHLKDLMRLFMCGVYFPGRIRDQKGLSAGALETSE